MAEVGVKPVVMQRFSSPRFHDNNENAKLLSLIESIRHAKNKTGVWFLSVSLHGQYGHYESAESARVHSPEINSVTKGLNRSFPALYPGLDADERIRSVPSCL